MKTILKPIASLRLTVILLILTMILILVGTSAQKETGIWEVQHWYFHSFICGIQLKHLLPLWDWWWQHAPQVHLHLPDRIDHRPIDGIPFPGGYTLIILLLSNLLAAHAVRFKVSWKRVGIIMIHVGLILLLVSEVVTSLIAVEAQMPLADGESARFVSDIREVELAVVDTTPADHDTAVVIAQPRVAQGGTIHDLRLPFDLRIDDFYANSQVLGPMQARQMGLEPDPRVNSGTNTRLVIQKKEPFSGVGDEAEKDNMPAAIVTPVLDGKPLGTYLLSSTPTGMGTERAQAVALPDASASPRRYVLQLRFKRIYKPYTIKLLKFTHENYLGTDLPRNFASRVELIDPANGVDREVVISMNHPLRYGIDTLYQAKTTGMSDGGEGTVLQVVRNPNWLLPYLAVIVGGLGLVIHFGMTLNNFLHKRAKEAAAAPMLVRAGPIPVLPHDRSVGGGRLDSYSLQPKTPWGKIIPTAGVTLTLLLIAFNWTHAVSSETVNGFNMSEFGRLAIYDQGRTLPLDSLARSSLKIINGKETLDPGIEGAKPLTAIQWLADMMSRPEVADDYKVFRVDNPDIQGMLHLKDGEKRFSFNEVFFSDPKNPGKIEEQARKAFAIEEKKRGPYETKMIELYEHATLYVRLSRAGYYRQLYELTLDPKKAAQWKSDVDAMDADAMSKIVPGPNASKEVRLFRLDTNVTRVLRELLLPELYKAASKPDDARESEQQRQLMDLYFAAPLEPNADPAKQEKWIGLGQSVLNRLHELPPEQRIFWQNWLGLSRDVMDSSPAQPVGTTAAVFFGLLQDYHDQNASSFNSDLTSYEDSLRHSAARDASRATLETFFNRFDPFFMCEILYVVTFIFVCIYWLTNVRWLVNLAMGIGITTLLLHTSGLIMRMVISGRPPVTNLYSSAVMIGWAAVGLCLGLEFISRKGMAVAIAAIAGFLPLLIADALATRDPDTMGQLRAVLDTNFWLATHVVCVTLGYATTYLAGLIAMAFVIASLANGYRGGLDKDQRKVFMWMTYGVICFALLFSFVGTILGGIWADQSWGRFWGWDPKENGAALIVLWNAVILHARWGGLVREKGVMILAIFGNIMVSWSWFGTNMLGIGLHAYGFMAQQLIWLSIAVGSFLVFMIAGAFVPSKPAR